MYRSNYGIYSDQHQTQTQMNKQLVRQKQDLALSNNTMMVWLTSLEALYNFYTKQNNTMFGYYDFTDFRSNKGLEEIKKQFETQLLIFSCSYKEFVSKYGEYDFPNNFKKEDIVTILERYYTVQELQPYCFKLKQILIDNICNPQALYGMNVVKKPYPLAGANCSLNTVFNVIPSVKNGIDDTEINVEDDIQKGGNGNINAVLNQNNHNNMTKRSIDNSQKIIGKTDQEIKQRNKLYSNNNSFCPGNYQ